MLNADGTMSMLDMPVRMLEGTFSDEPRDDVDWNDVVDRTGQWGLQEVSSSYSIGLGFQPSVGAFSSSVLRLGYEDGIWRIFYPLTTEDFGDNIYFDKTG